MRPRYKLGIAALLLQFAAFEAWWLTGSAVAFAVVETSAAWLTLLGGIFLVICRIIGADAPPPMAPIGVPIRDPGVEA